MNAQIIDFSGPVEAETTTPAADRLIAGDPRQTIANYFADAIAAVLRRPLVELARKVAHPLFRVGVLLPH